MNYIHRLAKTQDFLVLESLGTQTSETETSLIQELEQSLTEVKMAKKGKLKLKTLKAL